MFSSQLVINGNATQAEIARAFGVPLVTVKRYVKLYRHRGVRAFFAPSPRPGCDSGTIPGAAGPVVGRAARG